MPEVGVEAAGRHEGAAYRLYLLDVLKLRPLQQFVEVGYELVEDAQILLALEIRLVVHFVEVDDAREDDADVLVVLGVFGGALQLVCDVPRDDVVQQPIRLIPHGLDLLFVSVRDHVAVETESVAYLELSVQKPNQDQQQHDVQVELLQMHLVANGGRRPRAVAPHRVL
ncbi:unnamed protein product [Pieris brassicae]|uniref:Uncharacterized protein n=1 Tax=Pieris brassicae TaxID=7116 RepID=A0A9P0TQM6_PIEBR|nr:unnamed protein product [Pieris brassicae]